jgi:hypothetical protein
MTSIAKKHLLIALFCTLLIPCSYSQDTIHSLTSKPQRPDNFWHRVSVGGNVGFQFGNVTAITVAPEVRIRTVDQLHVGLRFIYQYISYKNYFYDISNDKYLSYKSNVFGGGVYLRYYLSSLFDNFLGNVFAHVEYEYLAYKRPFIQDDGGSIQGPPPSYYMYRHGNDLVEFNSFFVGGGYRQPIGNRVAMDLLILFNVNDTYNSPYSNPVIRIGVGVGL